MTPSNTSCGFLYASIPPFCSTPGPEFQPGIYGRWPLGYLRKDELNSRCPKVYFDRTMQEARRRTPLLSSIWRTKSECTRRSANYRPRMRFEELFFSSLSDDLTASSSVRRNRTVYASLLDVDCVSLTFVNLKITEGILFCCSTLNDLFAPAKHMVSKEGHYPSRNELSLQPSRTASKNFWKIQSKAGLEITAITDQLPLSIDCISEDAGMRRACSNTSRRIESRRSDGNPKTSRIRNVSDSIDSSTH